MARDFDLVEKLAQAGKLSEEEVTKQLEIITSPEAIAINRQKTQRILIYYQNFAESIFIKYNKIPDKKNIVFNSDFKPEYDELCKDLYREENRQTRSGYIFDPNILKQVLILLSENMGRFDGQPDVVGLTFQFAFGMLQYELSVRDKQFLLVGLDNFLGGGTLPARVPVDQHLKRFYDVLCIEGRFKRMFNSVLLSDHEAVPRLASLVYEGQWDKYCQKNSVESIQLFSDGKKSFLP